MMMDRIADMLTRIRNAQGAGLEKVEMPSSHTLEALGNLLKEEGYVQTVKSFNHKGHQQLRLILRYDDDGAPVIREIKRISKPGRRVYAGADDLPRVSNGYGVAIISTSKGIMSDRKAREAHVGGEILCSVF